MLNRRDLQETPPLNIPTPTPAPCLGGPVAYLGGRVARILLRSDCQGSGHPENSDANRPDRAADSNTMLNTNARS